MLIMGTIISIIRMLMYLFPFLKELFIGKDKQQIDRRSKPGTTSVRLKKLIIILGCASVAINFYLIGRVYDLGRQNLMLQKQMNEKLSKPITYPIEKPLDNQSDKPTQTAETTQSDTPTRTSRRKPQKENKPIEDRSVLMDELEKLNNIK
jgi:hypothetical protein